MDHAPATPIFPITPAIVVPTSAAAQQARAIIGHLDPVPTRHIRVGTAVGPPPSWRGGILTLVGPIAGAELVEVLDGWVPAAGQVVVVRPAGDRGRFVGEVFEHIEMALVVASHAGRSVWRTIVERQVCVELARAGVTRRQIGVLSLVRAGASNAEMADVLGLSVETVKDHLTSLRRRFGASSKAELAEQLAALDLSLLRHAA